MDYRAVAKRLLQERPQTMAVILARLPSEVKRNHQVVA
jgi:flagellar motor switch protein FliG